MPCLPPTAGLPTLTVGWVNPRFGWCGHGGATFLPARRSALVLTASDATASLQKMALDEAEPRRTVGVDIQHTCI